MSHRGFLSAGFALLPRRAFLQGACAVAFGVALREAFAQSQGLWQQPGEPAMSRAELSALLNKLLDAGSQALHNFAVEAYAACVLGKIRVPDPPLKHAWIVPGGGFIGQWLWDTMFVVDLLSLLPGQKEIIRGVFQNYWDFQQRWNAVKPAFMHGMVANFIKPFDAPGHDRGIDWETFPAYSQAPLLAWGMERVYLRNRDRELLRAGLAPLESFHEWYWRERDLTGLGLVGVGAYSGVTQQARYETYDHEVDLDGLKMIPHPGRPGRTTATGTAISPFRPTRPTCCSPRRRWSAWRRRLAIMRWLRAAAPAASEGLRPCASICGTRRPAAFWPWISRVWRRSRRRRWAGLWR